MANKFKNSRLVLTTTPTDAYTCPTTASAAIILNIHIANTSTSNSRDVTVSWIDSSSSNAVTRLAEQMTLPCQESLVVLGGKLVLEPNDKIQAKASAASDLELTLAIMELS